MSIITNILAEGPLPVDLGALRDRAYDRCNEDAESLNIYYSVSLQNLSDYTSYEPDPLEVAELLGKDQQGDWRAVMQMAAFLATRAYLEAEVEADLAEIEAAVQEATLTGYEAKRLYGTCAHGWAPHASETDWEHGTLYEWKHLDGGLDAAMVRVGISGESEVWLDLIEV